MRESRNCVAQVSTPHTPPRVMPHEATIYHGMYGPCASVWSIV